MLVLFNTLIAGGKIVTIILVQLSSTAEDISTLSNFFFFFFQKLFVLLIGPLSQQDSVAYLQLP